jgi:hypothetical protein
MTALVRAGDARLEFPQLERLHCLRGECLICRTQPKWLSVLSVLSVRALSFFEFVPSLQQDIAESGVDEAVDLAEGASTSPIAEV